MFSDNSQTEQAGLFAYQGADFTCNFTEETRQQILLPPDFCEQVKSEIENNRYPNTRSASHNAILNHLGVSTKHDESAITIDEDDVEELGYGLGEMVTVSSMDEQQVDEEETEEPLGIFNPDYRNQENRSPSSIDWDGDEPDSIS